MSSTSAPERIPREIWVLVAAAFVIAVGFGLISPVLPAYARSFDVGVAAASVVVSAFAFFRLVFAPAGGSLVSRLGERPVYLAGLVVVALSSLATAFAQSYWQLLVFRGVGGLGSTLFTVSAMSLLVRLAPPRIRGRVSSAYASSFLLGGMLGPVIGGLLAQLGLRVPFVLYAVALLVAAGVVAVFLGGTRLRSVSDGESRPTMLVSEALASPTYRAALASSFANGWSSFGVRVAVLPQFAVAIHDATWVAGAALAISAVGTAAALQVASRWSDTIGRRPLALAGLAITAVGIGLVGTSQRLDVLFVLCVVAGIGAGLLNPSQQAAVADVVGRELAGGRVLARFQMAQDAGAIIGPILIGVVADRFGWTTAFAVTGVITALAIGPWLRARESAPGVVAPETA